jgi:hypothetical protein
MIVAKMGESEAWVSMILPLALGEGQEDLLRALTKASQKLLFCRAKIQVLASAGVVGLTFQQCGLYQLAKGCDYDSDRFTRSACNVQ